MFTGWDLFSLSAATPLFNPPCCPVGYIEPDVKTEDISARVSRTSLYEITLSTPPRIVHHGQSKQPSTERHVWWDACRLIVPCFSFFGLTFFRFFSLCLWLLFQGHDSERLTSLEETTTSGYPRNFILQRQGQVVVQVRASISTQIRLQPSFALRATLSCILKLLSAVVQRRR